MIVASLAVNRYTPDVGFWRLRVVELGECHSLERLWYHFIAHMVGALWRVYGSEQSQSHAPSGP